MECVNCSKTGHTFRDCKEPVMSFGICAIKFIEDIPYYLLICRRDSLGYVEFLRGKYKLDKPDYIQQLINGMTLEERGRLTSLSFEKLWENLWNGQNTRQFRNEFEAARKVFENLRNTGDMYGKLLVHYIESATTKWIEPEWGFPKGRRTLHEDDKSCALREFSEETGFYSKSVHLIDKPAVIEEYIGTNGIHYKQTYFIGACASDTKAEHQPHNRVMAREVRAIGWFLYEDALLKIRETNKEKRALLAELHRRVCSTEIHDALKLVADWTVA